ncbi:galactosyl transferase [Erwinia sp. Ejp617]|nr:glycosyltransferase family 4 protein [Erwinia sp. Ejp617]ADP12974.1 galactosyl transferase [Erwinia sp. Ejp617]
MDEKKKSLCYFINSGWYFELHWLERAMASLNEGYTVHLIAHFTDPVLKNRLQKMGLFCHESGMSERSLNPFSFLACIIKLCALMSRITPDIIHSITIKPILVGGVYSRFKNVKFIASFVGLGRVFQKTTPLFLFLKKFTTFTFDVIFKNVNSRLIFEHKSDMELIKKAISADSNRMEVIEGAGVNVDQYAYAPERQSSLPVVLFASRLIWSKGLKTLVEIKKECLNTPYDFVLNVAGIEVKNDSDAIPVQLVKSWHDQGVINWLGQRNDVSQLIADANIVALPSTYFEGIPRILIEACATGRACIAYDIGGCSCLIDDGVNGYIVNPGNEVDFALRLKKLLRDESKRREMGIKGRDIITKRFSSEIVISKTLQVYQSVLN